MNTNQIFTTNTGTRLNLESEAISDFMKTQIEANNYEREEAAEIPRIVQKGERVLEIGAGIGYVSTLAWNTGHVEHLSIIEANPDLIPIISETHQLNGVEGHIMNGCLGSEVGKASFYIHEDFWASSLAPPKNKNKIRKVVGIPTISFSDVLREVSPTLIICDIEGGEARIFDGVNLYGVNKILVEVHQRRIGRRGMFNLFETLHRQGFHYDQFHSKRGLVLVSHISR